MSIRTTELGFPVEIFNVIITVDYYGIVIIPCSSEDQAECVVERAYNKYVNILDISIQRAYLDEWNEDIDHLH